MNEIIVSLMSFQLFSVAFQLFVSEGRIFIYRRIEWLYSLLLNAGNLQHEILL